VLAENNFGDTRSGGLAGPMGLFIILLLAVATVLLIRNMSARIRRLPAQFPDQNTQADGHTTGGSVAGGSVANVSTADGSTAGGFMAESQAAESQQSDRNAHDRQTRSST